MWERGPAATHATSGSNKRVKGRSHSVEERTSTQSYLSHATSQPSLAVAHVLQKSGRVTPSSACAWLTCGFDGCMLMFTAELTAESTAESCKSCSRLQLAWWGSLHLFLCGRTYILDCMRAVCHAPRTIACVVGSSERGTCGLGKLNRGARIFGAFILEAQAGVVGTHGTRGVSRHVSRRNQIYAYIYIHLHMPSVTSASLHLHLFVVVVAGADVAHSPMA